MGEITGLKTKFYREGDTAGTYEEIAQIASITPPQPEREVVEVDELDPPGEVRKKLAGLIDAGEASLTLNFDPANIGMLVLNKIFEMARLKAIGLSSLMTMAGHLPLFARLTRLRKSVRVT